MAEERSSYPDGVIDPVWVRMWSALYPLCLVMLTTALIVVVVFATEDLTALVTVLAGLALALALH